MPNSLDIGASRFRPVDRHHQSRARALTSSITITVLWVLAIIQAWSVVQDLRTRVNKHDFSVYYLSAFAFREHLDPYVNKLNTLGLAFDLQVGDLDNAGHPPTFLLFFEPLTFLTPATAYWTWNGINLACLAVALIVLQAGLSARVSLFLLPLALLYAPLSSHFHWSQSQLVVLLLLVLAKSWLELGREELSGVALALASMARLFPTLMVGYLLLQRKWRALLCFAAAVLASVFLTLLVGGSTQTIHFTHGLFFLTAEKWLLYPKNVSLRAFLFRAGHFWPHPLIKRGAALVAELGIIATTLRRSLARTPTNDEDWPLFSLWVVTSIVLSPTAWDHYLVLLFIPFFKLPAAAVSGRVSSRSIYAAVGSYMFTGILPMVSAYGSWPKGWLAGLWAEKYFAGLVLAYMSTYWFVADSEA